MKRFFVFFLVVSLSGVGILSAQQSDSLFMVYYGAEQIKDSTDTQRFDYHFYEGLRLLQNNKTKEAIAEFHYCMDIKLTAELYYELSRAYLQMNESRRAFDFLKKAAEMNPNSVIYQETLANYHIDRKSVV